jgi:hypothetical protein
MKPLLLSVFVCLSFSLFSQDVKNISGSDGAEDYVYVWIDSDNPEGPGFSWIDISSSGTEITGLVDDGVVGPFDIGFEFPFYGQSKSQFWINSNGCVSFNSSLLPFANGTIPTNTNATDFIAWFWDDLNPSDTNSKVYYQTFEDTLLVIQFKDYAQYLQQSNFIDAEVVMFKSGKILVQYLRIDPEFLLESASIGLQSYDGMYGLSVAHNEAYVHEELAVLFEIADDVTGLDENFNESQKVMVYPNPADDVLNIELVSKANISRIEIINMQGTIVKQKQVDTNQRTLLDVSDLTNGLYIVRIFSDRGIYSNKVTIE